MTGQQQLGFFQPSRAGSADDVVAGLVNNGSAEAVAGAAISEAMRRGSRVRFIQVLPAGLGADERADAERVTFGAALRALRGQTRVPCTFEAVDGEPGEVLVERSLRACVLVVGRDTPLATTPVARYCQQNASCDVLTVSIR